MGIAWPPGMRNVKDQAFQPLYHTRDNLGKTNICASAPCNDAWTVPQPLFQQRNAAANEDKDVCPPERQQSSPSEGLDRMLFVHFSKGTDRHGLLRPLSRRIV
jgi:hypothetical protein